MMRTAAARGVRLAGKQQAGALARAPQASAWRRVGAPQRQRQRPTVRACSSTSSTAGAKPVVEAEAEEGWSLRVRVGGFIAFLAAGGAATFTYMLSADEDFVFSMRDRAPALVDFFAPWAGLPVAEVDGGDGESGEGGVTLDVAAYFPRDMAELVGESVPVACVLRSGKVVVVPVGASATMSDVDRALLEKLGVEDLTQDPVVSFSFVDSGDEAALAQQSQTALAQQFAGHLQAPAAPEPGTASKQELANLMAVLRSRELDVKTTLELAKQYGEDTTQATNALAQIEDTKRQVKAQLK